MYMKPGEMTKTLIDTSTAILIYKAGLWPFLTGYYHVTVPRSVYEEMCADGHPGHRKFEDSYKRGKLTVSYDYRCCLPDLPLRGGERDVILLYLSGQGDFVLIDDKKGGRYCRENAIPYTNALMMARALAAAGCVDEGTWKSASMLLLEKGRYSEAIKDHALNCDPEELRFFYP